MSSIMSNRHGPEPAVMFSVLYLYADNIWEGWL